MQCCGAASILLVDAEHWNGSTLYDLAGRELKFTLGIVPR
ncbi:hypothetical protein Z949_857 [Sulfitobacter guttiformis KCTC 32187]|nr:hypothetical protein Z949_857 [Sulfitobacter guttiformis KCTC 32187]